MPRISETDAPPQPLSEDQTRVVWNTQNESANKQNARWGPPSQKRKERNQILPVLLAIFVIWSLVSTAMYSSVQSANISLQTEHYSLESDYGSLQSDYNSLYRRHESLQSKCDSLRSDYDSLRAKYDNLLSDYNSLVSNWNSRIELEKMGRGYENYPMNFITPEDTDVKNTGIQILGHSSDGDLSWDDMNKINAWVGNNIAYNHDTGFGEPGTLKSGGECWLFPNETLALKRGDCEDQALLMASLCSAEAKIGWLWVAELSLEKSDGSSAGHLAVFLKVGGDKMHIYDPTWGWSSGSSKSEQEALNQYTTENGFSSVKVERIFNMQEIHSFDSNQEFFDWF